MRVYNTLTRRKEEFVPLHEGFVGIYVCGPTVYDDAHLGHAKTYVSFDVVVRYLRYLGYKVRYVQNITDVGHLTDDSDMGEDKIERRALQERVEPMELAETYTRNYFRDMDALNVLRPDISPRASGHIPEQIELVKTLIDKGYAYEVNGSVYFEVAKFPKYGKLSRRRVEEQEEGARVAVNPDKRHPADFALWKRAEPGHILRWPSPWGWGYPGWHLECSIMSTKYLGQPFDIHGGGLENVFPHHESEIAQSEAATGQPFARYWLHNNMLTVDGVKMGKSLGNFTTLSQAFERYSPLTVRFFILNSHYRSTFDFSDEALAAADKGLRRLLEPVVQVRERLSIAESGEADEELLSLWGEHKGRFLEAMDDDFNTAAAIGVLFDLTREVNLLLSSPGEPSRETLAAIDGLYRELGTDILGIIPVDTNSIYEFLGITSVSMRTASTVTRVVAAPEEFIQLLVDTRSSLRSARLWELADEIRNHLAELGIALEDTPQGTVWKRRKY